MDTKDCFETDGITYDWDANSFVVRIKNRKEQSYARIIIDKDLGENFGTFIKPTQVTRLGWGAANPKKHTMDVLTFNVPEEGIAYKVVYDYRWNRETDKPIKVFSSTEEGKWSQVKEPTEAFIKKFEEQRDWIGQFIRKRPFNANDREQVINRLR